jgi:perosamine synthetase
VRPGADIRGEGDDRIPLNAPRSIQFAKPWITGSEREAVLRVLAGDILTHGPENKAFEAEFSQFTGGDAHCVAVSSCMAALHLAYWQMGIGPGDEVLVTAQTHVATANAVEIVGAQPVFIDCEPETGNIDPSLLERAVTKHTRAIGLVHFLGIPCDMDPILEVAARHNLKVVEDCALAIGARYHGTHVGLLGNCGCFSFYPAKHMTTGDGGMFITRDRALAERAGKARAFGVDRSFGERSIPGIYDVPTLGLNFRMSDINAAVGRMQLARIGEILDRRGENFARLSEGLAGIPHLSILDARDPGVTNSHYCLSIVLDGPLAGKRNEMAGMLNRSGVGTSVYYPQPVPRMTYYRQKYGYDGGSYPQAARISDQSIALPVGPHLGPEDMDYMAEAARKAVKELRA